MNLNTVIEFIKGKDSVAAEFLQKTWEVNGNPYFEIIKLVNQTAVSIIGKGVIFDKSLFERLSINEEYKKMLMILFHELGHTTRFDKIEPIQNDIFRNNQLDVFIEITIAEEDFATNFANEKMMELSRLSKGKGYDNYAHNTAYVNRGMIKQTFMMLTKFANRYDDISDCVYDIMTGKLNPMQEHNQIRKQIRDYLREFVKKTMKNDAEPAVLPVQPKVKPGIKPAPAPAKPGPRRIVVPRIHPGADPEPKAQKK